MSRQREWQKYRTDAGLCSHCGGKVAYGKTVCAERLEYLRRYKRGQRAVGLVGLEEAKEILKKEGA